MNSLLKVFSRVMLGLGKCPVLTPRELNFNALGAQVLKAQQVPRRHLLTSLLIGSDVVSTNLGSPWLVSTSLPYQPLLSHDLLLGCLSYRRTESCQYTQMTTPAGLIIPAGNLFLRKVLGIRK